VYEVVEGVELLDDELSLPPPPPQDIKKNTDTKINLFI
jgi:hypothetical protein